MIEILVKLELVNKLNKRVNRIPDKRNSFKNSEQRKKALKLCYNITDLIDYECIRKISSTTSWSSAAFWP